jgi:uncharacterized membrane protein
MRVNWLMVCAYVAVAVVSATRLVTVVRNWSLPLKAGPDWFLSQRVKAGFYGDGGAALLRRYRVSLLVALVVDAPLSLWLALSDRYAALVFEQWIALVVSYAALSVMLVHFSHRAAAIAGPSEAPEARTVQLSMAPRRLRGHTTLWVELAIVAATLLSFVLIARRHPSSAALPWDWEVARRSRSLVFCVSWLLYLQLGLLLLKAAFVRWRMPLPAKRTDDFRRWRQAWLTYYLRLFDGLRLMFALLLLTTVWRLTQGWGQAVMAAVAASWILAIVAFVGFSRRDGRRLAAVAAEVRPLELAQEFPRRPLPSGPFLVGGLMYLDRDNPAVLVRSHRGIALNLAHPATYAWLAYLGGLIALTAWVPR